MNEQIEEKRQRWFTTRLSALISSWSYFPDQPIALKLVEDIENMIQGWHRTMQKRTKYIGELTQKNKELNQRVVGLEVLLKQEKDISASLKVNISKAYEEIRDLKKAIHVSIQEDGVREPTPGMYLVNKVTGYVWVVTPLYPFDLNDFIMVHQHVFKDGVELPMHECERRMLTLESLKQQFSPAIWVGEKKLHIKRWAQ